MKLPNHEQVAVSEAKILRYLLDESHEEGHPKAVFFMRFGFGREHWRDLAEALRRHGSTHEVAKTQETPHGAVYVVEGPITCPDGRSPQIRSVWFVDRGAVSPRFVTAYPLD